MAHRYAYLDAPLPIPFAHRGGAAEGDENSMAAFARAVAAGYHYLETDVHSTSDDVAVVFHDDTLDRMLGRSGRIEDLSWADVTSLRMCVSGGRLAPGGAAARIRKGGPERQDQPRKRRLLRPGQGILRGSARIEGGPEPVST